MHIFIQKNHSKASSAVTHCLPVLSHHGLDRAREGMALLSGGNKVTKEGAGEALTLRTDEWPVTVTLHSSGKCGRRSPGLGGTLCLACVYPASAPYPVPSVSAYGPGS